jgi:hypothetical protein
VSANSSAGDFRIWPIANLLESKKDLKKEKGLNGMACIGRPTISQQGFSRLIFNRPSHILEDPEMFRRLIYLTGAQL